MARKLQSGKETDDQAMPDLRDKFAPGELVADEGHGPEYLKEQYGNQLEHLPKNYQEVLRKLCQKIALRDMFARMKEVRKATEQRFYWRGEFSTCWDDDAQVWAQPGLGLSPFRSESDTGDVSLSYPLNIYQQKGREHISLISKIPGVRFEAKGLRPNAMKVASDADDMRTNIETSNSMEKWVQDAARYSWTDSRVCFYQRWVTDGARFGYEDEKHDNEEQEGLGGGSESAPEKRPRQPKGGELTTPFGVLEVKVPINMREMADFPFIQLAYEIDIGSAKSLYPWYAERLSGGQPGPGEYNYDRTCRLAITQGTQLLAESGDTTSELPTWQRTWIRPAMFAEIDEKEEREFFEDNFPDGAFVAFIGETYCESRNESLDDHWKIWHPLPGDGQATPSCGEIILPVQDAVNDLMDLKMERNMKSIPALWCKKQFVDLQAISKQKAGPGAHYPLKGMPDDVAAQSAFFAEPTPQANADESELLTELFGDIPEALTGLFSAAIGSAEEDNPTFGGLKLKQDAAKGQSGIAWRSLRECYAGIMMQLVRIGAHFRSADTEDDGMLALSLPGKGEVTIDLEDLRDGNFWCFPDGDESYPRTHADKAAAVQALLAAASKNPALAPLVALPKNMVVFKDAVGIPELEIPGADLEEKQLSQIDRMLKEPPVPNMQAREQYQLVVAAAVIQGQPAPPEPPFEAMWNPIIKIQPEDDNPSMVTIIKGWLNSPEGTQADEDNPEGTQHVRLLLGQRQKLAQNEMQEQQQQAMLPQLIMEKAKHAGQAKTPAESINFKDLGPSGKMQVGAQAGLDLRADAASDTAHETVTDGQAQPTQKPPQVP